MDAVVRVTGGLVRGSSRDGVSSFLGIPYAGPAVGEHRYRLPQPVVPWDGERDATAPGPTAAQAPYPPPMDTVLPSSVAPGDDYLNVNVWAPDEGSGHPVMVWLPGGAFVRGANSVPIYDGSTFARDGIVLVAVNYPARRPRVRRSGRRSDQPRSARPDLSSGMGAGERGRVRWRSR